MWYIHIYNGILLSHKKELIGSFVEMWMDLETVMQSEVSQKEKTDIVQHGLYVEFIKMFQMNLSAKQK